jgi:hypothetical protein
MKRRLEIVSAVLVASFLVCAFFVLDRYVQWRRERPTARQVTIYRISELVAMCNVYHQITGTFPPERLWSRSLIVTLSGDKDLIDMQIDDHDVRRAIDWFYDGWGRPMRHRFPGVRHPDGYDIYSVGPDGQDDGGENDDIVNW